MLNWILPADCNQFSHNSNELWKATKLAVLYRPALLIVHTHLPVENYPNAESTYDIAVEWVHYQRGFPSRI